MSPEQREIMLSELLASETSWLDFCLTLWRDFDTDLSDTNQKFDLRAWPFDHFRVEMCTTAGDDTGDGLLQYAMLEAPESYPRDPRLPRVTNDIGLGTVVAETELARFREAGYSVGVDDDGTFTHLTWAGPRT